MKIWDSQIVAQMIAVIFGNDVRPVAQLVERRTPSLLPVRGRVRDASALDIYKEPPDGDDLRSVQRS